MWLDVKGRLINNRRENMNEDALSIFLPHVWALRSCMAHLYSYLDQKYVK